MSNNTEYQIHKISLVKNLFIKSENINNNENFKQSIEIRVGEKTLENKVLVNVGVEILIGTEEEIINVETSRIYIDTEYQGIFEITSDVDENQKKFFREVNAPTIIYPFVREHVLNITNRAQINPIIIPPHYFINNKSISKNNENQISPQPTE